MTPLRRKLVALAYGAVCHGLFAAGVGAMIANLYAGMSLGRGPFHGAWAVAANLLLLLQFPVVHSLLLTPRGRAFMARLAPRAIAHDMAITIFATVAAIQILLVFTLWSPVGRVLWSPSGAALSILVTLYAASWLFLQKALWDAGLAIHSGYLGWSSVFAGRSPERRPFPRAGLFRVVRQPVYLGFALTLWTGPVWTADRAVLAILWSAYCIAGPRLKERRYARRYGPAFDEYRERVPYMMPSLSSRAPR